MSARVVDGTGLLICAALVLLAGAVSLMLRLGMERKLAVSALRASAQLLLVGYALRWLFAAERNPLWVIPMASIMLIAASRSAVARASRGYRGDSWSAFVALVCSGLTTSIFVTGAVLGAEPWIEARTWIPLLGMILGNSMNGLSLALDSLLDSLDSRRALIEADLACGATAWEAAREPLAQAVKKGMIPMINAMMVVGIVSLPGMMTGQILSGADPLQASRYQLVVMFMLCGSAAGSALILAFLTVRALFDGAQRLRAERIEMRPG
jgi:putative ABC transport system permease protein